MAKRPASQLPMFVSKRKPPLRSRAPARFGQQQSCGPYGCRKQSHLQGLWQHIQPRQLFNGLVPSVVGCVGVGWRKAVADDDEPGRYRPAGNGHGAGSGWVGVIVVGALFALVSSLVRLRNGESDAYYHFRRRLGRAILLGLELLVAAEFVGTVAVEPTLENVLVLAFIVLIRTFLSVSLTVEIEGRWPWQGSEKEG
jgi:uncharacterized membrane protein